MVFIVFNFSLLVNSGILARLCVHAAVPELQPIALLSMWNSSCLQSQVCGVNVRQPLAEVTAKEQSCLPQTATCGEGGEDFSLPWPCLQDRNVEVSRGAGEEPFNSNH